MPRKGNFKDPLVIYDEHQSNMAASYCAHKENKVSFSDFGMVRGDWIVNQDLIRSTLGNIKHNGSVQIFVHGDGLGKIVIRGHVLTRNRFFQILANIVNERPDLYPNISINEVLLIACGGGNNPVDLNTYQEALMKAREIEQHPFANEIKFVSPLNWYQFGNGSFKMYKGGAKGKPIPGTTILLSSLLTAQRLVPLKYYFKQKM